MSFPPWSASPKPSNSTESPSEAITLSTAALKVLGESTENGIASRAIQSSSVVYVAEASKDSFDIPFDTNIWGNPFNRQLVVQR